MLQQKSYYDEPEWYPEAPQEDCEERRQRQQSESEWEQWEQRLKANPELLNHPSLPF